MARKFDELRKKMSPEAQERARIGYEKLKAEMALTELRAAAGLTQTQLAKILEVSQAEVSKIEKRTDMYVSTLASYVKAMGGKLEIRAVFPDSGSVEITQFSSLAIDTD